MFERRRRGEALSVVRGDWTSAGLLMFATLFMVLLFIIGKETKQGKETDPPNQGTLCAESFWPDQQNADVDLWTDGPIGKPVGYSNLGGELWNLQRDDLGTEEDASGKNMEISCTRGIVDGEYIINLQLYNLKAAGGKWLDGEGQWRDAVGGKTPLPVRVIVRFKKTRTSRPEEIAAISATLRAPGEEITVIRFKVVKGVPDMSTAHHLFKPLRSRAPRNNPNHWDGP